MVDGPRGCLGRLTLAGPPEAVAYAQWLLGQRLAAAASYQVGGWGPATTAYGACRHYLPTPAPLGARARSPA